MAAFKHKVIGAGLATLAATRLHRIAARWTRGAGVILTFHRVANEESRAFAPNRLLTVKPAFLDELLGHVRRAGYRIVRLDEVLPLLRSSVSPQPFVVLTFDDGYRDTLAEALPILERHQAPFMTFATTGFLDRTARLWWVELERALASLPSIEVVMGGERRQFRTNTARAKTAAFAAIVGELLKGADADLLACVAQLSAQAKVSSRALVDELCMDWSDLKRLADHPLASIGCHTLTHPRLSRTSAAALRNELAASRSMLEDRLGVPVRHICYPYGGAAAAGPREFAMAQALGYACGVTTRPGVLFPSHARVSTALPRISINGLWQTVSGLDVLLSGLGSAIWNGGRIQPSAISATTRSNRPAPST